MYCWPPMADKYDIPDLMASDGNSYHLGGRLKLETKERSPIDNQLSAEAELSILQQQLDEFRKGFVTVQFRSISFTYNCVGFVFASRRAQIDTSLVERILHEDKYASIARQDVAAGDLVLYRDQSEEPTHIGFVVRIDKVGDSSFLKVVSKWGYIGPECVHSEKDVPATYGSPKEYYRERHHIRGVTVV